MPSSLGNLATVTQLYAPVVSFIIHHHQLDTQTYVFDVLFDAPLFRTLNDNYLKGSIPSTLANLGRISTLYGSRSSPIIAKPNPVCSVLPSDE